MEVHTNLRSITALAVDAGGSIWAGTSGGLVQWTPEGSARLWTRADGLPGLRIRGLQAGRDGLRVLADGTVVLRWETAAERDNLGFNLYRAESLDGERVKLNERIIRSSVPAGGFGGALYQYVDPNVPQAGQQTFYWLEDIDIRGGTELHGPLTVQGVE